MKKIFKNKKVIVIALVVIAFGCALIGGIKAIKNHIDNNKEEKYVCTVSTEKESDSFSVNYKGGKPETIKLIYNISGPKEFLENGEKNESSERVAYEQHVTAIYLTYNAYKDVKGFTVETKEEDGEFVGEISLDYSTISDEHANGLFAKKDEKIEDYTKRLKEFGYTCKVKE